MDKQRTEYYHSVEELKKWERINNRHCINWDNWDRVIKETREQLASMNFPQKTNNNLVPKWVYQASSGKPLGNYQSTQEVLDAFPQLNLTRAAVNYYAMTGKPYYKLDLFFSNEPIILKPRIKQKMPRLTVVYDLTTNEKLAVFETATEAEEYFQMPKSQVGYCIRTHNGVYKKKNLRFEYQSI